MFSEADVALHILNIFSTTLKIIYKSFLFGRCISKRSNMLWEQEWERKKAYLIRSLFQDLPALSPIPEEDTPSLTPGRYSPLPPLIIEREPNKHDEPEEHYQELETKMRKLYKKLFWDESTSSVDEFERYLAEYDVIDDVNRNDKENEGVTKNVEFSRAKRKPFVDLNNTFVIANTFEKASDRELAMEIEAGAASNDIDNDSSQFNNDFRQVVCVAQVHREDKELEETHSLVYEVQESLSPILGSTWKSHGVTQEVIDVGQLSENGNSRESIPEIINLDTISESAISNETIETMRGQNIRRHSVGSIRLTGRSFHISSPIRAKFERSISLDAEHISLEMIGISNPVIDVQEASPPMHAITSTKDTHFCENAKLTHGGIKIETELRNVDTKTALSKTKSLSISSNSLNQVHVESDFNTLPEVKPCKFTLANKTDSDAQPQFDDSDDFTTLDTDIDSEKSIEVANDSFNNNEVVSNMLAAHTDTEEGGIATSTPKSTIRTPSESQSENEPPDSIEELNTARMSSFPSSRGTKRSLDDTTSPKRKKYDTAVQTLDTGMEWDYLKSNFFVGVPRVFKLCSCHNHNCSG